MGLVFGGILRSTKTFLRERSSLRQGELLQERPTDIAVALFVASALLGAEDDLRAITASGVFVATVGVLARNTGTAVLLCPELEVLFGAEEVQTITVAAIATLVFADVVGRATEHDDGNWTCRERV